VGSSPIISTTVISQEIGDSPNLRSWVRAGSVSGGALGRSGGLVVLGGVEDQLAEQLPGGGVDHADMEVVDEQDDAGSGVGSADAGGPGSQGSDPTVREASLDQAPTSQEG